jgi:hypothetical protein
LVSCHIEAFLNKKTTFGFRAFIFRVYFQWLSVVVPVQFILLVSHRIIWLQKSMYRE